jgi:hypothetical protein
MPSYRASWHKTIVLTRWPLIVSVLKRAPPEQVRDLSYLMHALQRLPLTTPGVCGDVTLATRHEEFASYRGFELGTNEFILTTGKSMNFGCGTDHEFRKVLEVGTSAMRDLCGGDDFTEWLNMFTDESKDRTCMVVCKRMRRRLYESSAGMMGNEAKPRRGRFF